MNALARPADAARRSSGPHATTWIQPRYMARFACLAEACPDTCCKGWTIDVDPPTARRYRTHPDPARRARLTAALADRRAPGQPPRTVMRSGPDGCCTLLRADGLCSVHAELGEDWLATACRSFPRLESGTGSLRHRAGSIGCVEVVRRVLLEPDALVETTDGDPLGAVGPALLGGAPARGPALGAGEVAFLRSCILRLLGRHDLPWSARVALFCVTLEDLARIDLVRDRRPLLELGFRTEALLARAELSDFDRLFPGAHERTVPLLVPILRVLVEAGAAEAPIAATARDLTAPFRDAGGKEAASVDVLAERYARAARTVLEPQLAARPHVLGNLLGATLLHERFPIGRPSVAVDNVWNAALFFALWKVLTVGTMEAAGSDFETAAVEVAYRLGRTLAHWPAAKSQLRRDLDRRGARTPALLASLLR